MRIDHSLLSHILFPISFEIEVLNDVLDFDRLDSGRFSTVKMPYNLHQAIRAMLVPLRLAANARGLTLHVELDRNIDAIARHARLKDGHRGLIRGVGGEKDGKGEKENDHVGEKEEKVERGREWKKWKVDGESEGFCEEQEEDADCLVVGDEMRLRQIITNLARCVTLFLF